MKKIVLIILSILFLSQSEVVANEWEIDLVHTGFHFDVKHIFFQLVLKI